MEKKRIDYKRLGELLKGEEVRINIEGLADPIHAKVLAASAYRLLLSYDNEALAIMRGYTTPEHSKGLSVEYDPKTFLVKRYASWFRVYDNIGFRTVTLTAKLDCGIRRLDYLLRNQY